MIFLIKQLSGFPEHDISKEKVFFFLYLSRLFGIFAIKDGELTPVRKNPNIFGPLVLFCSTQQIKCKHLGCLVNWGLELCFAGDDVNFSKCGEDCPYYTPISLEYTITTNN